MTPDALKQVSEARPLTIDRLVFTSLSQRLDVLRGLGWSVAVHNDYRQDGEARTFWLLTHPNGRWIKGEGLTDEAALDRALALLAAEQAKAPPDRERLAERLDAHASRLNADNEHPGYLVLDLLEAASVIHLPAAGECEQASTEIVSAFCHDDQPAWGAPSDDRTEWGIEWNWPNGDRLWLDFKSGSSPSILWSKKGVRPLVFSLPRLSPVTAGEWQPPFGKAEKTNALACAKMVERIAIESQNNHDKGWLYGAAGLLRLAAGCDAQPLPPSPKEAGR